MERKTDFFVILDCFCPLSPPPSLTMDPENQNFGKMNNIPKDIIISQMHTLNDSHMM